MAPSKSPHTLTRTKTNLGVHTHARRHYTWSGGYARNRHNKHEHKGTIHGSEFSTNTDFNMHTGYLERLGPENKPLILSLLARRDELPVLLFLYDTR